MRGTLRPLLPTDAEQVLAAFASADDMARQGDVTTIRAAREYVDRLCSSPEHLAIAVSDGVVLVGLVVVRVDTANRSGWVSYWMHASCRGRGWTARAVATVADQAFRQGGLQRLELAHRANNPASGAVARAAGFVVEGVERGKFLIDGERVDSICYGRLPTDPWPTATQLPWHSSEVGATSTALKPWYVPIND